MDETRVETRLHVTDDLAAGREVGLDHGRAHFLRSVLRLSRGAHVAVFNARDGEWLARIDGLGKGWCSLAVEAQRREPAPEPDVWTVFAPIKRARIDFLAEKATELGCAVLQPVITERTAVSRVNIDRLAANAREAVRPIERVTVWARRPAEAQAMAARVREAGLPAFACTDLAAACGEADIVSCATLSTEPLVRGAWLAPGSHLDLIGSFTPAMREADDACFEDARVFVDTDEALQKSGDLLVPMQHGVLRADDVRGTLTTLSKGVATGRKTEQERTVFKSVGTALEDLAAAVLVYESAQG